MRDDFAVFIITHKRLKQDTYELLKKYNYTGKLYFLCDNMDDTRFEIIKRYGSKNVIIFDKKAYLPEVDTMTNREYWDSPVFVERFMYDIADIYGINYFIRCDDDITDFSYRYVEDGSLKQRKVKNIDAVFEAIVEYMEKAKIVCLSPAQSAAYIGGLAGNYSKGFDYKYSQMVFCNTKLPIEWKGFSSSDFLSIFEAALTGRPAFRIYPLSITSPQRGSNAGGMKTVYEKDKGFYMSNFLATIIHPSSSKIVIGGEGEIKGNTEYNYIFPKIISESYKK